MNYALLTYEREADRADITPEEGQAIYAAYGEFHARLVEAGVFVAGFGFEDTRTAKTVTAPSGTASVTDGPFDTTTFQLTGFFVIDTPSMEEAIDWGAQVPAAEASRVEIRPIIDMGP